MPDREKVVNDLNVSKIMLCNPKMLTSEMCVKIGQAINDAIDLLKEQEAKKPKASKPICKIIFDVPYYFCGDCKAMLNMYSTKAKFCSQCGQVVQWSEKASNSCS
jgi:hypothetical protein